MVREDVPFYFFENLDTFYESCLSMYGQIGGTYSEISDHTRRRAREALDKAADKKRTISLADKKTVKNKKNDKNKDVIYESIKIVEKSSLVNDRQRGLLLFLHIGMKLLEDAQEVIINPLNEDKDADDLLFLNVYIRDTLLSNPLEYWYEKNKSKIEKGNHYVNVFTNKCIQKKNNLETFNPEKLNNDIFDDNFNSILKTYIDKLKDTHNNFEKLNKYFNPTLTDPTDPTDPTLTDPTLTNPILESIKSIKMHLCNIYNLMIILTSVIDKLKTFDVLSGGGLSVFVPTSRRVLLNGKYRRIVYKKHGKGVGYVKMRGEFVRLSGNFEKL